MTVAVTLAAGERALVHEAVLYDGAEGFDVLVGDAVRTALAHDLPVFAVAPPSRLGILQDIAGDPSPSVLLADMSELGRNPARTISAAEEFFARHPGRRGLFVGEPLGPERTAAERAEVLVNEAVVDVAFADAPLSVVCPYDVSLLDADALDVATCCHACVLDADGRTTRHDHDATAALAAAMAAPLDAPPADAATLRIEGSLHDVRELVRLYAAPLLGPRMTDLVLAANELAANTLRHAGGGGVVRVWHDERSVLCEVSDGGRLSDLTVGRRLPDPEAESGRGLWMTTQLCDLTQIRTDEAGTTVRLTMAR